MVTGNSKNLCSRFYSNDENLMHAKCTFYSILRAAFMLAVNCINQSICSTVQYSTVQYVQLYDV